MCDLRGGAMRGIDEKPTQLFSYVDLERRIPLDHPLRAIRALVDKVLAGQSRTFGKLYGWMKTVGILRKTRHRGRELVEWFFVLTAAAYNLLRIPKILAA